jgi:serine/threonine-protein kinase
MTDTLAPEFVALQQAVAGRYSLERELGRGGMGIVFLARDVALDRPVAIKLLPPQFAAQATLRERFLREAQMAAKLSHPNIVPIYAVEQVGDLVFFVMAYVEGETLGHRVRSRGPITPTQAIRLLQEVAWALAYAHLRGIVHRDIKPDNILLEADTGRALVTDFGIARATETSGGTQVGEILGTAHYMSPEQACGEPVDGRSDIYSLGIVAFFAVSGRLPFDAPDVPALLAMQITKAAPPLASAAPGVPGRIAQAVDRCLVKDPAQRWPTGEAFAEALAQSTALARELPAPLRLWLTKGDGSRGIVTGWTVIGATITAVGAVAGNLPDLGEILFFFGPAALFALYRVRQSARLLAEGYGLDDIRLGLRQQLEQRREELAYEYSHEPTRLARFVRLLTYTGLATVAVGAAGLVFLTDTVASSNFDVFATLFGIGTAVAVGGGVVGNVFPGRKLQPRDRALEWRAKYWNGRFGQWLLRIAGTGVTRKALPAAAAHRPTEVAIGMAAEGLFEALPRDARKELADLPHLLKRLEADAQAMRARMTEIDALLAGVGERTPASGSASLGDGEAAAAVQAGQQKLRDDLGAERERVAKQLAASVGALETIRLGLLRLKAGVGTVQEITADLSAARDVANQIDVVAAGHEEVGRLLSGERPGA